VFWFDAQSSLERMTLDEIKEYLKPINTQSVGYLILETKEYVVLGFTDFDNGLIKHHQAIPRKMIKSIKVIRDGQK
jgi:hypothetical protein